MPLPPIPGAQWEIGGELTYPKWNKLPYLGHNPAYHPPTYPPHVSLCGQCVAGRYGCLHVTILTKYPPLGEDSDGNPPSFPLV